MDLLLSNVTGFACSDKTICIKQRGDNKTLYFQDNPAGVEMTFNVPAGKWTTNNKLRKLKKPLVYICPPIAEPELHRERKPFKFRVESNPNKVTISFAYKNFADIKCDPEIWAQSIPAFVFVMMHEHGHYYYGGKDKDLNPKGYYASETKCDIYACNKMLQNGFNPSQCIWGINLCLSDAGPAKERKSNVLEWVNKVRVEREENFMKQLDDYIGKVVMAKQPGIALDAVTGSPVNVKVGDSLGKIDGWYGPESNLQYSTDRGLIIPAKLVLNTEDLKLISASGEKTDGKANRKGGKTGSEYGHEYGLFDTEDLVILFMGLALIFGSRRNG